MEKENPTQPVRKSLFSDDSTQSIAARWNTVEESTEIQSYKRWSIFAIVAFLIGVLSLSGFLYIECLLISLLGMIVSLIAYFLILRSQGTLVGARVALLGLALSIFSCVGVATTWTYYEYTVRREADRFFRLWFDVVKTKDVRLIVDMRLPTWSRQLDMSNEEWWKSKMDVKGEMRQEILSEFLDTINHNGMRTLMALGDDAEISYYKTAANSYHDSQDRISIIYAVTMIEPERQTFFIQIYGTRSHNPQNKKQLGWALQAFPKFIVPEEFSQTTEKDNS